MKDIQYTVAANREIAKNVYEMTLMGDTSLFTAPGQFINIKIDDFFLRRPISVCDYDDKGLKIIYKVVGEGTKKLAAMGAGAAPQALAPLGNGYDTKPSGHRPLLAGGGAGVPPLYGLCRQLIAEGKSPIAILGFNTAEEIFYAEEFREIGADVIIATADGSAGVRGFVTDAMKEAGEYTYFYACGPKAMLQAVDAASATSGQLSFEERMGCGFGACMGCSCKTKGGYKRICKEGPVLLKEEIIW